MNYTTLSQLQNKIKTTIERNITAQWVLCDISDLKVNISGHCYLELVEKSDSNGAIPRAKAMAIIWKSNFNLISNYFQEKTGVKLSAGFKVMLLVEVNYHELYGLSLVVRDIDPTYSLGDIERIRRETIAKLTSDGIIEMNRELYLPVVIENIAIISSPQAAGYGDFINHIEENDFNYKFNTKLHEAVMQGAGAEDSIISALIEIASNYEQYDAVIIIRGGGSQSDLSCFNNYTLCSYIAQFPIPVITGIGHDRDQSVADIVAHTPLKTPTAVANFLIDTKREFEYLLDESLISINNNLKFIINDKREEIELLSSSLKISTLERTASERVRLERAYSFININSKNIIYREAKTLNNVLESVNKLSKYKILRHKDDLKLLHNMLLTQSKSSIKENVHKLELFESKIDGYDTKHILKLGYSIATINGKVLKSIKEVKKGDSLSIKVKDGVINTTVN